tara:strand:+ start:185 stop:799 length:615 start_codon:yes stop_codon:yes gene_type:complete
MATIINADTSAGLKLTSDTSGEIKLQSAGADIATVSSTGLAMASGKTLTGGGKILQVVQNQKTDTFTSTTVLTSTVEVTGANATITPSSSSSKVLVMISGAFGVSTANYGVALQLKRGTTLISMGDLRGSETRAAAGSPVKGAGWAENFAITFLDSPSTTSATTYKLFLGVESGATASIGGSYASADTYNMSIPTNIVLMEVAG